MYFGAFKDHMRHGEGTMLDDTHNELFQGQWANDKPSNKAVAALTMRLPDVFIHMPRF